MFAGKTTLRPSRNAYDWLGHGVYFWEGNPTRALEFANFLKNTRRPRNQQPIKKPTVVGAVIDPKRCLNLLDTEFLHLVRDAYVQLSVTTQINGGELPKNRRVGSSRDLLLRDLDCAVIEFLHGLRDLESLPGFDTVRGVFIEGEPLYPNAGFHERNHVQICVRNPECIVGYFRPLNSI